MSTSQRISRNTHEGTCVSLDLVPGNDDAADNEDFGRYGDGT